MPQKGFADSPGCFPGRDGIAASLVWLGKDYIALGQYDAAKAYIDQSLNIREKTLGENHPDYAWSLDSLSHWYEETGELNKAIETMERVIAIRRDVLGPNHQYTRQAVSRRDALCAKALETKPV